MVVLEYWAGRARDQISKPLARYLNEFEEALDDSAVENTVEALEQFQFVEGETVEYEGRDYEVVDRNVWLSLALPDNQYKIEDESGYTTKTVFEDDLL
jgi:hypothetical protein